MDLTLSESERAVQQRARDFLAAEITNERLLGFEREPFPAELWALIASQGWFGAGVPEADGGGGGSLTEWAITLEEMGRAGCPGPVLEQLTLAAALVELDAAAPARQHLAGLLAGSTIGTIAVVDRPGTGTTAAADAVSGEKVLVPWGESATLIAVAAGSGARRVYRAVEAPQPAVRAAAMATMSENRQAIVAFDRAPSVTLGAAGADEPRGFEALHQLARDAYLVGLLGRMLDMAVTYATNRVQFGRPIGSFQAIQHRCADMALAAYGARILTYQAAWMAAQRRAGPQAAMAHACVRDAAGEIVAHAHQIHGAIGITKEYPLQYFSRRAKAFQNSLGTAAQFREKVATALWGPPP